MIFVELRLNMIFVELRLIMNLMLKLNHFKTNVLRSALDPLMPVVLQKLKTAGLLKYV